jgi:hypothetical protein
LLEVPEKIAEVNCIGLDQSAEVWPAQRVPVQSSGQGDEEQDCAGEQGNQLGA